MLECQTFQKNRFVRQLFLHVLLVLAWPQVFSAIRVKRQEAQQWLEHKAVPKKCCYYCLLYREQRSWLQDSVSGQCYLPDWKQKNLLGVLGKRCCMFSVWLWQGCHFWQGAGGSYPCRCSRSPIPITQRHCTVADEWVQFSCWVALQSGSVNLPQMV